MKVVDVIRNYKRRDNRREIPMLSMRLDGKSFTTRDWSLGGFCIRDYKGSLVPGDYLEVTHIAPVGKPSAPVQATACVVRRDVTSGELGCAFSELGGQAYEVLEKILSGRYRV